MAAIQKSSAIVYLAPTLKRRYFSARAAASGEARAMMVRKYPTERFHEEEGGGWHWASDERLVRVHARLMRRILRAMKAAPP